MKLVDLVSLKEDLSRASMEELEALARQAQDIQDSEAGYAQQQGDFDIDKFGNEFSDQKVMPYGGEYYSMNDIQDAIATRLDKSGDVPYDVAIGRMTQDEYDKYMSTVKPDRDSFEKSSKFDRMNETELTDYQKSIAAKWDKESEKLGGGLFDTSRELEKTDVKQFNINVDNKVSFLTKLRNDGRFKSTKVTDDKIESWSIKPKIPGLKIAAMLKPEANEGSCGYGIDGVPGDTPGETKGARADDRTNGMVKMLRKTQEPRELKEKIKKFIQKEISKLHK